MKWLKHYIINSNIFKENFCKKNNHDNHALYSTVSSVSQFTSENKAIMATMAMGV
jgi:hypothetical protein